MIFFHNDDRLGCANEYGNLTNYPENGYCDYDIDAIFRATTAEWRRKSAKREGDASA